MNTTLFFSGKRKSALQKLDFFLKTPAFSECRIFILTDNNVYEHCLPTLVAEVEALQEAELLEVESGETSKTPDIALELWKALLDSKADSDTLLVNLGGGMISDLGGFVAAGYKRGIRYINIPTSLLAMVDASIGGKTAVNMGELKNQIGFFHSPLACCIDPVFLETLPPSELLSGLGETLKTAILKDNETWRRLEDTIWGEKKVLETDLITECTLFKYQITKTDPFDKSIRKILNFGHTFGHAIESWFLAVNKPITHGHAIAWGILYELYLSTIKLGFPTETAKEISSRIQSLFPTHSFNQTETEKIFSYLKHDKKNQQNQIQCVLLKAIGQPEINITLSDEECIDLLQMDLSLIYF